MAGDIGGEVEREVRDLVRAAVALVQIGRAEDLLALLVGLGVAEGGLLDPVYHRGLNAAGADVVAVDAVGAELEGHTLGQAGDRVLGGAVGAHAGGGGVAAVGGDGDDRAAALLDQIGGRVLHEIHHAEDVDAVNAHVAFYRAVLDELILALVTCVGDDYVDVAEIGRRAVDKGLDLFLLGDVADEGLEVLGGDVERGDEGVELLLSRGGERELAALGGERAGERLSYAAGGTVDEYNLVFQLVIHFLAFLSNVVLWFLSHFGIILTVSAEKCTVHSADEAPPFPPVCTSPA